MHSNLSAPTNVVCCREVFAVRGVCYVLYKRFYCSENLCIMNCLSVLNVSCVERVQSTVEPA